MNKPVVLPSEIAQQLAVYLERCTDDFCCYDSWHRVIYINPDKLAKAIQEFYDSLP